MRFHRLSVCALVGTLTALSTARVQAATATYDVTYTGTGISGGSPSTVTGSGSFTISFTSVPGMAATLTAFDFMDTVTETGGNPSTSTFTYGLANVNYSVFQLAGTLDNPVLADATIETAFLDGSPSVVPANFTLQYAAVSPLGSTLTTSGNAGYQTNGPITVTPASSGAPEPATLPAMGLLGFLGVIGIRRRWFQRA